MFYFYIVLSCLFGGFCFSSPTQPVQFQTQEDCPFCNEEVLNRQIFYEDDLVYALCSHKPIYPGHFLIIPKRHVERFEMLSDEEMMQIGRVIQKVHRASAPIFKSSSYLLLQKNGPEVGQTVPHVHFHYIPRQAGDSSAVMFFVKMQLSYLWYKPLIPAAMQELVDTMKEAMRAL
jgi:diadenosine tetraphosphate (Ap4A) HIT family hydrolase